MSDEQGRGAGRTTDQIVGAPKNAVFICNHPTHASKCAEAVNRGDLTIVTPKWLEAQKYRWKEAIGIIIDHDVVLTWDQKQHLQQAMRNLKEKED